MLGPYMSELRQDRLTHDWVIVSPERALHLAIGVLLSAFDDGSPFSSRGETLGSTAEVVYAI